MESKIKKILGKLMKDEEFLSSLDSEEDLEEDSEEEPHCSKRKAPPSPIKTKKVKLPKKMEIGESSKSGDDCGMRSPDEVSGQPTGPNDGAHESSSDKDIDILAQLLSKEDDDFTFNDDKVIDGDDDQDDSDDSDFEIMGGQKEGSWAVSKKVMKWFNKVADIELEKPELDELKKSFLPSEEEAHHFQPPKLPLSMWQNITGSSNHADAYRLKSVHKAQEGLYLALCPLLSALDSCEKSIRPSLTSAIQLVCSSNLLLNKYRRASVASYIKKDIRKHMLSLPVTHDNLFGKEFEKTTEGVLKEHAVLNKVLQNPTGSIQQRLEWNPSRGKGKGKGKGPFRGNGGRKSGSGSNRPKRVPRTSKYAGGTDSKEGGSATPSQSYNNSQ